MPFKMNLKHLSNRNRPGHTLLELLVASALTALAIVPALKLIGDGMVLGREVETRNLLTTLCVSKLEEQLAHAAANWTTTTATGNFAADGYPSYRFTVLRSDAAADGGMEDRLMAVQATVWNDADGDGALGANEMKLILRSKVAKLALYQNAAGAI